MTTSDEAFLAEVENFLAITDLPTRSENVDNKDETSLTLIAPKPKTLERMVGVAPEWGSMRRHQTTATTDAAAKRELERAKDRKRRRAYRERRQIERESLQRQVDKLTEELHKAKEDGNFLTSAWKALAERQLNARQTAEAEQRRLAHAIDTGASLIGDFQALVSERLADLENDAAFPHQKRVRLETSDDEIFEFFIKELDAVYARTDETLRAGGLDSTDANWDGPSESWDRDPDTGYFQFYSKVTLPFDFQDICRSRWHSAHLLHRQESRQLYEGVGDPENTVAIKFRITTRLASGQFASVAQRFVLRRFENGERMVIAWRLFTEGEGAFSGLNADETGWGVAAPATNSSKTGTVMMTCVHNVPMHLKPACQPAMKVFANKLVEWGLENKKNVANVVVEMLHHEGN